jgi:hypothetical protein
MCTRTALNQLLDEVELLSEVDRDPQDVSRLILQGLMAKVATQWHVELRLLQTAAQHRSQSDRQDTADALTDEV